MNVRWYKNYYKNLFRGLAEVFVHRAVPYTRGDVEQFTELLLDMVEGKSDIRNMGMGRNFYISKWMYRDILRELDRRENERLRNRN